MEPKSEKEEERQGAKKNEYIIYGEKLVEGLKRSKILK